MNKYMTLDELKSRIPETDKSDGYLQELLDDVIEHVIAYTNNTFKGKMPRDVKRAVAQLVVLEMRADELIASGGSESGGESSTVGGEVKAVTIDGLRQEYSTSSDSANSAITMWDKYHDLPNSPYNILRYHRLIKAHSAKRRCGR